VESEGVEGKGSTFIFLLPFGQGRGAAQPQADALEPHEDAILHSDHTPDRKLNTVLIIDDEPALLELLTQTLSQKGLKIIRTADGRRGVELAAANRPDVIILDYSMPEFSGAQVVEQLRANPRTKDIPILIHTGAVLNEQERQQLAGHVRAIASKTDRGSLLAELERLDGARAAAATTGAVS
jgi:CheY-like chemotaxis protein